MEEWNAEIDRLEARADRSAADIHLRYYEEVKTSMARTVAGRRNGGGPENTSPGRAGGSPGFGDSPIPAITGAGSYRIAVPAGPKPAARRKTTL
jgi:hypothetical protein